MNYDTSIMPSVVMLSVAAPNVVLAVANSLQLVVRFHQFLRLRLLQ
jgi:hypothetical protein